MSHSMSRKAALAVAGAALVAPRLSDAQTLTPLKIAGVPEESIAPALWTAVITAMRAETTSAPRCRIVNS